MRPEHVTRTITNGSAVLLSRVSVCITWQVYCTAIGGIRDTDVYLAYIRFGIILTQFYVNFSRQEHHIDVLYVSFNAWISQVSSYTAFHFSFTAPLNIRISESKKLIIHLLWTNCVATWQKLNIIKNVQFNFVSLHWVQTPEKSQQYFEKKIGKGSDSDNL